MTVLAAAYENTAPQTLREPNAIRWWVDMAAPGLNLTPLSRNRSVMMMTLQVSRGRKKGVRCITQPAVIADVCIPAISVVVIMFTCALWQQHTIAGDKL